jgi:hypothetical protein
LIADNILISRERPVGNDRQIPIWHGNELLSYVREIDSLFGWYMLDDLDRAYHHAARLRLLEQIRDLVEAEVLAS